MLKAEQRSLLPPPGLVRHRSLLNVKPDFWLRWQRGRFEERAQLLEDFPKSYIMNKQGFINFSQTLENGGICSDVLAQLDERADDVNAHGRGTWAV